MTRLPEVGDTTRAALTALAEAALQVIDELTAGELLAAITPERLGNKSGYAPSSVRYQLSRAGRTRGRDAPGAHGTAPVVRKQWAFDREHVLLIALDALGARQRVAAEASVQVYLSALAALEQTGDLRALAHAVKTDLDEFTPGATAMPLTSERVHTIAVAAADGSTNVARSLRRHQDDRMRIYLPIYERGLVITGRVLRDGISLMDLALQVNMLLEGVSQRRRFEPALDETHVLGAVLAIFHGLTRPADDPDDTDPTTAIAEAVARRSATRD